MRSTIFAVALLLPVAACARPPSLPDPFDPPGAGNPAAHQANIGSTVCRPGWTRTIRPGRPLLDGALRVVAQGEEQDPPGADEKREAAPMLL